MLTAVTLLCFILATTPLVLATNYEVEIVVPSGKKSKETDAVLSTGEKTFSVTPDKSQFKEHSRTFAYDELKAADYSYSKKPLLSVKGSVATAILLGVFALPLFFMKKKNHWLTVQNEKEFAVIKMGKSNYRSIIADLETHGVTVNEVKEEDAKEDK